MSYNEQQVTSSKTSSTPSSTSSSSATTTAPMSGHHHHHHDTTNPSKSSNEASSTYDHLFDSGYSATAMSLNSSSDVHISHQTPISSGNKNSNKQGPPSGKDIEPCGDSGLCIDSGLSIECSSPEIEKQSSINHPFKSGQSQLQQRLQSSSSSSLTHQQQTSPSVPIIGSSYECFLNNSFGQDDDGDTLLHLAIIKGSSRLALEIITLTPHPDYLDIRNHLYQTPLILAALTGQTMIAHRLILAGATIDKRDRNGLTPLHIACSKGDIDMVSSLVTPLSDLEIRELTRNSRYQSRVSGLDTSAWNHKIRNMIHAMNYEGETCLHLAAKSGNKKLLELLVNKLGADVNVKEGKSGWTILHWSIFNQKIDMIQFLIHFCRPDVNALSYAGHSCLYLANAIMLSTNITTTTTTNNQDNQQHNRLISGNIITLLMDAGARCIPSKEEAEEEPSSSSSSEYSSSSEEEDN